MAKWELDGKTALVVGGGEEIGRAIALALSARGVRVLVTGPEERPLGETVGEIVHGGGKGRHLAGDIRDAVHLEAALTRATEVFGSVDLVIAAAGAAGPTTRAKSDAALMSAYCTFQAAGPRVTVPGKLFAVARAFAEPCTPGFVAHATVRAGLAGLVQATALELASRNVSANLLDARQAAEPEAIAALLCLLAPADPAFTGQTVRI